MTGNVKRPAGAQTLARGLLALDVVVSSPDGVTVQELADRLGVHRTIVTRVLSTLAEFRYVARGADGRYRGASGLLGLRYPAYESMRAAVVPVMRRLATDLSSTVSLIVEEGGEAVALAVVVDESARYRLTFAEGSSHPIDRAAAGRMLQALGPERKGESAEVTQARAQRWARSFGEVEPGAHGLAVPLDVADSRLRACFNLITYREDVVSMALAPMRAAAAEAAALLRD